jgi:hypothetical protein
VGEILRACCILVASLSHLPFPCVFCRVIFGMLIALPITLVYYILLGL